MWTKDQAFSEPCWQDSWGQFSAPSSKASTVSLFWFQQMNIWILNKTQQHPWCYWQVLTSHKAVIVNQWEFCVVETTWNLNSSELSTVAPFTLTLTHLTSAWCRSPCGLCFRTRYTITGGTAHSLVVGKLCLPPHIKKIGKKIAIKLGIPTYFEGLFEATVWCYFVYPSNKPWLNMRYVESCI